MAPAEPAAATAVASPLEGATGTWQIALAGELDLATIAPVRECVTEVLAHRPERVVVDCHALAFMDSTAIGLLLETAAKVPLLELRSPPAIIRTVLEMMGLADVLQIVP